MFKQGGVRISDVTKRHIKRANEYRLKKILMRGYVYTLKRPLAITTSYAACVRHMEPLLWRHLAVRSHLKVKPFDMTSHRFVNCCVDVMHCNHHAHNSYVEHFALSLYIILLNTWSYSLCWKGLSGYLRWGWIVLRLGTGCSLRTTSRRDWLPGWHVTPRPNRRLNTGCSKHLQRLNEHNIKRQILESSGYILLYHFGSRHEEDCVDVRAFNYSIIAYKLHGLFA